MHPSPLFGFHLADVQALRATGAGGTLAIASDASHAWVGDLDGLDAADRAEGLEILRPVEDARAARGEEGAQLLIGKAAVADEVLDRVCGRLRDVLVDLARIEVAEAAGQQVDQRVAGGHRCAVVAVLNGDRSRPVVCLEREGDERRPAIPADAAGAVVEAFGMREAVHREARRRRVQAALP